MIYAVVCDCAYLAEQSCSLCAMSAKISNREERHMKPTADTTATKSAISACQFWLGLEYMNLAGAPDTDERRNVFGVRTDTDLPWNFPSRQASLRGRGNRYKGQIAYCGLYAKRDYVLSLQKVLGQDITDPRALRVSGDGAVLLIPLDDTGRVCGEVFISSLPWMMARLRDVVLPAQDAAQVSAFSGFDDFMNGLMSEVSDLLVQLQLTRDADARTPETLTGEVQDGMLRGPRDMRPLALDHVHKILALIWRRSGWQPDWAPYSQSGDEAGAEAVGPRSHLARFKVVTLTRYKERRIDLGAMNSMVAVDVERVRRLLVDGAPLGAALRSYLKLDTAPQRLDLRDGDPDGGMGVFVDALRPTRLPAGAWPDFPLVTAQQFAVNASRVVLEDGGLYGVNGPPGTGKSTLLRDVVADTIVTKAELLAGYDDPLSAFSASREIDGHKYPYWTLDAALHGHGVVVTSSNNGAVENVINDLPKRSKPMDAAGLSYFSAVSDSIAAPPKAEQRADGSSWGLVAALLGSGEKKRAFLSRFWFEAAPKDPANPDPLRLRSLRGLIGQGDHGASAWAPARKAFRQALQRCRERAQDVEDYAALLHRCQALRAQVEAAAVQLGALQHAREAGADEERCLRGATERAAQRLAARRAFTIVRETQGAASQALLEAQATLAPGAADAARQAQLEVDMAVRQTELTLATKPGFWDNLFHRGASRAWATRMQATGDHEMAARRRLADASSALAAAQSAMEQYRAAEQQRETSAAALARAVQALQAAGLGEDDDAAALLHDHSSLTQRLATAQAQVRQAEADVGAAAQARARSQTDLTAAEHRLASMESRFADLPDTFPATTQLAKLSDEDLQRCVAFNDPLLQALRVEVFRAAMALTESFVVAAWKRLGPTLSAFVDLQSGKLSVVQAAAAAPHLWNAFFLVVPVVSSTFASFDKLFASLGQEALGLLLIDEAGQSTPQNAVGAIWRSRRVIAVGDPLQLEPVVPQPVDALAAWRQWLGAELAWAPPRCSVQTLADGCTPYGTYLGSSDIAEDSLWVGSPLRVHRRCLNPMFRAANEIVYAHLMVHGVVDDTASEDWVGPSRWFDICGASVGHWVPDQGDFAHDLILRLLDTAQLRGELRNRNGAFHINVITPYRDVAVGFKSLLHESHLAREEKIHEMAGTVHTFQGKEADVVILLLGGNTDSPQAIASFAGDEQSPNLLNVALTRAKKRLYVVGDKALWVHNSATFRRLAQILDEA
ncbi:DEAD/DEAH box helicase [Acidovorax sp. Leaf78]|uniref:DEAD/DEAH box helicase n=1 Tax=Acidovorax sp. Leaf78 TaxID=1736237 RepID=UPI000A6A4A5C|nr:DEAD/DEAH box helicase [Acidovorax sp. Leaf78]